MSDGEVKFKVKLDTAQAQAALDALQREGERTGDRLGQELRDSFLSRGLQALGIGAAFGAGLSAMRGATQSGIADVAGETFGALGQQLNDFFLGNIDDDARAAATAREEMVRAFAMTTGTKNEIPPAARTWFEMRKSGALNVEKGRSLLLADDAFYGKGVGAVIDRVVDKLAGAISAGFDRLIQSFASGFGLWG